jgi:hypothetical protein
MVSMNRARRGLSSLVIAIPVLAFALFCWLNWQPLRVVSSPGGTISHRQTSLGEPVQEFADAELWLQIGGGHALRARLGWLLLGTFALAAIIGVLTALAATGPGNAATRDELERLRAEKRKLAAANRALEAALPVLRERYDQALGGMEPPSLEPGSSVLREPIGEPEVDEADLKLLALEDATTRSRARREKARRKGR